MWWGTSPEVSTSRWCSGFAGMNHFIKDLPCNDCLSSHNPLAIKAFASYFHERSRELNFRSGSKETLFALSSQATCQYWLTATYPTSPPPLFEQRDVGLIVTRETAFNSQKSLPQHHHGIFSRSWCTPNRRSKQYLSTGAIISCVSSYPASASADLTTQSI